MALPDPLLDRFRADLAATGANVSAVRLGVAVSGGPDSLALLLLAPAALPGRVAAATVDHGLRPAAADEARLVAALCAERGIPHETLTVSVDQNGDGLQAAARIARYATLEAWRQRHGLGLIATAHHADDQAETLLMRLNRGAGVGGLAGIRAANGRLVRPLLGWRRAELEALVVEAGIVPLRDPSNADPRFDRVRMRQALAQASWISVASLAKSAANLADAAAALDWMTERLAAERITAEGDALVLDPRDLPVELVRRLLLAAIARLDPAAAPAGPALDRALAALHAGGRASLGALLLQGGPLWHLAAAPPRRSPG